MLEKIIPNFTWDLAATYSHDSENVVFNFFVFTNCHLLTKIFFLKDFAVPRKQIDYLNFMTDFELITEVP